MRSPRHISNATLTLDFEGPGTVWFDRVYLIGSDAALGIWRPDVVAALKAVHPGVIRFGGSTIEDYEWTNGIGPWDQRRPFTTVWGGLEENFVGLAEFIQLCQYVGAEPSFACAGLARARRTLRRKSSTAMVLPQLGGVAGVPETVTRRLIT